MAQFFPTKRAAGRLPQSSTPQAGHAYASSRVSLTELPTPLCCPSQSAPKEALLPTSLVNPGAADSTCVVRFGPPPGVAAQEEHASAVSSPSLTDQTTPLAKTTVLQGASEATRGRCVYFASSAAETSRDARPALHRLEGLRQTPTPQAAAPPVCDSIMGPASLLVIAPSLATSAAARNQQISDQQPTPQAGYAHASSRVSLIEQPAAPLCCPSQSAPQESLLPTSLVNPGAAGSACVVRCGPPLGVAAQEEHASALSPPSLTDQTTPLAKTTVLQGASEATRGRCVFFPSSAAAPRGARPALHRREGQRQTPTPQAARAPPVRDSITGPASLLAFPEHTVNEGNSCFCSASVVGILALRPPSIFLTGQPLCFAQHNTPFVHILRLFASRIQDGRPVIDALLVQALRTVSGRCGSDFVGEAQACPALCSSTMSRLVRFEVEVSSLLQLVPVLLAAKDPTTLRLLELLAMVALEDLGTPLVEAGNGLPALRHILSSALDDPSEGAGCKRKRPITIDLTAGESGESYCGGAAIRDILRALFVVEPRTPSFGEFLRREPIVTAMRDLTPGQRRIIASVRASLALPQALQISSYGKGWGLCTTAFLVQAFPSSVSASDSPSYCAVSPSIVEFQGSVAPQGRLQPRSGVNLGPCVVPPAMLPSVSSALIPGSALELPMQLDQAPSSELSARSALAALCSPFPPLLFLLDRLASSARCLLATGRSDEGALKALPTVSPHRAIDEPTEGVSAEVAFPDLWAIAQIGRPTWHLIARNLRAVRRLAIKALSYAQNVADATTSMNTVPQPASSVDDKLLKLQTRADEALLAARNAQAAANTTYAHVIALSQTSFDAKSIDVDAQRQHSCVIVLHTLLFVLESGSIKLREALKLPAYTNYWLAAHEAALSELLRSIEAASAVAGGSAGASAAQLVAMPPTDPPPLNMEPFVSGSDSPSVAASLHMVHLCSTMQNLREPAFGAPQPSLAPGALLLVEPNEQGCKGWGLDRYCLVRVSEVSTTEGALAVRVCIVENNFCCGLELDPRLRVRMAVLPSPADAITPLDEVGSGVYCKPTNTASLDVRLAAVRAAGLVPLCHTASATEPEETLLLVDRDPKYDPQARGNDNLGRVRTVEQQWFLPPDTVQAITWTPLTTLSGLLDRSVISGTSGQSCRPPTEGSANIDKLQRMCFEAKVKQGSSNRANRQYICVSLSVQREVEFDRYSHVLVKYVRRHSRLPDEASCKMGPALLHAWSEGEFGQSPPALRELIVTWLRHSFGTPSSLLIQGDLGLSVPTSALPTLRPLGSALEAMRPLASIDTAVFLTRDIVCNAVDADSSVCRRLSTVCDRNDVVLVCLPARGSAEVRPGPTVQEPPRCSQSEAPSVFDFEGMPPLFRGPPATLRASTALKFASVADPRRRPLSVGPSIILPIKDGIPYLPRRSGAHTARCFAAPSSLPPSVGGPHALCDLVAAAFSPDYVESYSCDACASSARRPSVRNSTSLDLPECLTVVVKRYEYPTGGPVDGIRRSDLVIIEQHLEFGPPLSSPTQYRLVCVIMLNGATPRSGHSTALAAGVADPSRPDAWHFFDDWKVSPVPDIAQRLLSSQVQRDSYVLLFSRVNPI